MFNYIFGYFLTPEEEEEIVASPTTKQNKYKLLNEIKQFDKNILLVVPQPLDDFLGKNESKIFKFKIEENKKKRTRTRKRRRKD